jgi:hypothetical protein
MARASATSLKSSPRRPRPTGASARTSVDPEGSNRVGLIVEVPSIEAWQSALQSEDAAEAMKYDGVRPETISALVEG